MHTSISPAILYWGTPVVLITSENPNGTSNIAPMSSAWWISDRCMLGLSTASQTTANLLRTGRCILNLPSSSMGGAINALARTTATDPVPEWKASCGYMHVEDKWVHAGLTPLDAERVSGVKRIAECPVHMEAELVGTHKLLKDVKGRENALIALEVKVVKVWVEDTLRMEGYKNRIDPERWSPAIMCFQQLYGLTGEKLVASELAKIDEEKYRR